MRRLLLVSGIAFGFIAAALDVETRETPAPKSVEEVAKTVASGEDVERVWNRYYIAKKRFQHDLFELGGELCIPGHQAVKAEFISRLEQDLDGFNADLPSLKEFILPGGGQAAAACHLARTIVRRAERRVSSLGKVEDIREEALTYLNRLSDLLFVVARVLARLETGQEVLWNRDRSEL